ncbi:hypothetical protein D3C81_602250 [compost metagenome]
MRMREAQSFGVQQHAVHALHAEAAVVASITVAGVADQVMEQMLEVPPNLPETPGLRLATQQRITRRGKAVRRDRHFTGQQFLEMRDGLLLHRLAGAAVQIVIHREGIFGRPAATDGQVILAHLTAHQRLAQRAGGLAVEGQQQAAAGGAVQPVHQENRLAQLLAQAVGEEVILATRQLAVVDHQTGRLVDHGQPLVLVQQR